MTKPILICWALMLAGTSLFSAEPDIRRDATVEAVEKVMPCVVNIATETVIYNRNPLEDLIREFYDPYYRGRKPNTQYSLGSGVLIDEEGYVMTNDHVVRSARRISVKLSNGREYECDRVATSTRRDIALLKIRAKPGDKFAAVKFAQDQDLFLGETVLALGNPFGLGGSVTKGILSSKNRRPPSENEPLDVADWLQTDAAINPGNSGGALINLKGELIGVNVAVYREGQGIGFAIPVKLVSEALSESLTPENMRSLWFGARIKAGTLPLSVLSVQTGSPADKAGLKAGDQILRINGKPAGSFIEFNRELLSAEDKSDSRIELKRDSSAKILTIRLVAEKSIFNEKLIQQRLGISLQELTPELAQHMGLNSSEGLLIAGVEKDTPAEKAGLQRGILVTGINGKHADDLVSTAKMLHEKKKGDPITLEVVIQRRQGPFIEYRQASVEIPVR